MPDMPFLPKYVPFRIVVYAKDIKNIIGCSERTARQMLQRIRTANQKNARQYVTVSEFCAYTGLKEEEVNKFLIN
jgi:hypothetical protein